MEIEDWRRAGLYDPESPDATDRLCLLEHLAKKGATLSQMIEAHDLGELPGLLGELVLGPMQTMVPIEVVAEAGGLSPDRVRRVLLAAGLPVDEETAVPAELGSLMSAFEAGAELMGEEAILAFTRVLGASANNIAEAAVALFYAELGPGTQKEGATEMERARVSEAATLAFITVPEALSRILMAQFDRANRRAVLSRGWSSMASVRSMSVETSRESLDVNPQTKGVEIIALGFVDLVGSTAWAESIDLRELSLALSRFESAAWASAVQAGGRVIKMIGDAVYFTAPSPTAACRVGIEVCRVAQDDLLLPAARGAIGFGPVTPREGDYFGQLVNLVARLVKTAGPGEIVVTEEVAKELQRDSWKVKPIGTHDLRGIERPVRAFSIREIDLTSS